MIWFRNLFQPYLKITTFYKLEMKVWLGIDGPIFIAKFSLSLFQ